MKECRVLSGLADYKQKKKLKTNDEKVIVGLEKPSPRREYHSVIETVCSLHQLEHRKKKNVMSNNAAIHFFKGKALDLTAQQQMCTFAIVSRDFTALQLH